MPAPLILRAEHELSRASPPYTTSPGVLNGRIGNGAAARAGTSPSPADAAVRPGPVLVAAGPGATFNVPLNKGSGSPGKPLSCNCTLASPQTVADAAVSSSCTACGLHVPDHRHDSIALLANGDAQGATAWELCCASISGAVVASGIGSKRRDSLFTVFRVAVLYGLIVLVLLGVALFFTFPDRTLSASGALESKAHQFANMRLSQWAALSSYAGAVLASPSPSPSPEPKAQWDWFNWMFPKPPMPIAKAPLFPLGPDEDGKYTISAEGIRAQFIPYGASITNLFINDTNGVERDIVLGYDNATYYPTDASHPHLGGVPGRYANRIKNSTFTINGQVYKVVPNENNGQDTLHGGPDGWDYRQFEVIAQTHNAITFAITDPDGTEGFPGTVRSYISYALTPHTWHMRMNATSDKWTPIMLSSHTYWNLDGFQNPNTPLVLNHTLWLPFSGQRVDVDGILIPTGPILPNDPGSVNDFWTRPKQIGASFGRPELVNNCGTGCTGYDNCWLVNRNQYGWDQAQNSRDSDRWWRSDPVASLGSAWSGIQIDIYSDQEAFQVYSCNGQNGSMPLKKTQGFFDDPSRPRVTQQYGCLVMEVEDWIDGINQPAWQRGLKQLTGPGLPAYNLEASYVFSTQKRNSSNGNGGFELRPPPPTGAGVVEPKYL